MVNYFTFGKFIEPKNSKIARLKGTVSDIFNVKPIKEYDGRGVHKIVFLALKKEDFNKAFVGLDQYIHVVLHEKGDVDVNGDLISKLDDKGKGIIKVIEHLGLKLQDTIGIGDSMNDYFCKYWRSYGKWL